MQSRRDSVIEVLTLTFVGTLGSWSISVAVLTFVDDRVVAATIITALCTIWSIVRGYCGRRIFNNRGNKKP